MPNIMENIAVLTMRESQYKELLSTLKYLKIDPISVKILPDDSELSKSNSIYSGNKAQIRKLTKINDEIRHNS